jgi:protein-L-isoaspartate O-methyltransferase
MTADQKLLHVLDVVREARLPLLKDRDFLTGLIRWAGLVYEPPEVGRWHYGEDYAFCNQEERGFYQIPRQFADFLVFLSEAQPRFVLEVGTWTGWTGAMLAAYVRRFAPLPRVVTIDPHSHVSEEMEKELYSRTGLIVQKGTSGDNEEDWDLVFIDGDHSYDAVLRDWNNLKDHSRMVAFHDANDSTCPGVMRLWQEVKTNNIVEARGWDTREFFHHSYNQKSMGIGVVCKNF